MIIKDEEGSRIFVDMVWEPAYNQIPNLYIKGREITELLSDNNLSFHLSSDSEVPLQEKQILTTAINSIPMRVYRFSPHYRYEIWETI